MNHQRDLKLRYRALLDELGTLDLLWIYCRLRYLLARQDWRAFVTGWAVNRERRGAQMTPGKREDLRPGFGCWMIGGGLVLTVSWCYILARLAWPVIVRILGVL